MERRQGEEDFGVTSRQGVRRGREDPPRNVPPQWFYEG